MQRKRKSCGVYIAERAAANRDREVEQLFSQIEMDALRGRLQQDAPTREKEKSTGLSQRNKPHRP
jgi:hypothetical protein